MNIAELLNDAESMLDDKVEVEGMLNVVENTGEIFLSSEEMDYTSSILISRNFWQFFEIISAVHPGISGIGNRSFTFSYPASIVGTLKKTGLSPFEYLLNDISSVSMSIEYDAVATMLVEPDYYHFSASIDYGKYVDDARIQVTSTVTLPMQNADTMPRLDGIRDFHEVLDDVVTLPGRILGDLRTSAISIGGKQGVNIAIDFPELVLMLRRCIEASTGFPMFPYDFEITGRLVRLVDEENHQQDLGMISENEPILVLKDIERITVKRVSFIHGDF